MRIAIIGAGWAGLACADRLLDASTWPSHVTSAQVTLFDAAPLPGGRARGWMWPLDHGKTLAIDNGQHLTIGAYTEMIALLARCGASRWHAQPLVWSVVGPHGQLRGQWRVPNRSWPWRVIASALPPYSPTGWPLAWRASVAITLAHLVRTSWQPQSPHQTFKQWIAARKAPDELIRDFWQPLMEGALNTSIDEASAAVALKVLKDSIAGPKGATTVWLAPSNLSMDGVDPIMQSLEQRGMQFMPGHRVLRIHPDRRIDVRSSDITTTMAFDAVVIACPARASLRLWNDSPLPQCPVQQRWSQLEERAITTVWVALDAPMRAQLSRLPDWFVFKHVPGVPHIAHVGVRRGDALALVTSAQHPDALPETQHQRTPLAQQVQSILGIDISSAPQKWITEKSATWACTASSPLPDDQESAGHTGCDGIFRAGDDLEPGYPATIESAVRSGRRTARTLMNA